MLVYNYSSANGEYLGISEADESPLEEGVFLVPAWATDISPGEITSGFAAVFSDGAWSLVEDHRGETWWDVDRHEVVIDFLGDPASRDLQPNPPPAPVPTSTDVNAERDRRIHAGFVFQGKTYAFDPDSKARVTGAATLAGFAMLSGAQAGDVYWQGGEAPFRFIANDNSLNEMDAQTCFAFGQAAAAHEAAHIFVARAIKDMMPIPADYTADQYWP